MKESEVIKKVREINAALDLERYEREKRLELESSIQDREGNNNRARSVTVGTSFGGTTELMMRANGGRHIWCIMQPVEVIELIHQLAANVGCHIHIKPRQDFSSWRDWKVTEEERLHYNGHAPFVNDMAPHNEVGANMNKHLLEKKLEQAKKKAEAGINVDFENNDPRNGAVKNKRIQRPEGEFMLGGKGADASAGIEIQILQQQLDELNKELENGKDTVAAKKAVNKRTAKRAARAS